MKELYTVHNGKDKGHILGLVYATSKTGARLAWKQVRKQFAGEVRYAFAVERLTNSVFVLEHDGIKIKRLEVV
jgi:hypothetical protein